MRRKLSLKTPKRYFSSVASALLAEFIFEGFELDARLIALRTYLQCKRG
jgi:hypothetical protein